MKRLLVITLLVLFTACFILPQIVRAEVKPIKFEFRLVDSLPSSKAPEMKIKGGKEVLHVIAEPAITEKDVQSAKLEMKEGLAYILIVLTPEGAKKFSDFTSKNINKRMAIVIDKQLIAAPTIKAKISTGKMTILSKFSEAEAKDIVDRLNKK